MSSSLMSLYSRPFIAYSIDEYPEITWFIVIYWVSSL